MSSNNVLSPLETQKKPCHHKVFKSQNKGIDNDNVAGDDLRGFTLVVLAQYDFILDREAYVEVDENKYEVKNLS